MLSDFVLFEIWQIDDSYNTLPSATYTAFTS